MFNKKILAGIITAMLISILPMGVAFASETIIFDDEFNNTYANDRLSVNWYDKQETQFPEYASGDAWASSWGAEGWYSDAEDGSLNIHSKTGAAANAEMGINKKIITDPLVDNSSLEFTYEFSVGDKPETSGTHLWFRHFSTVNGVNNTIGAFVVKSTAKGIEPAYAVESFYWPFKSKSFNRVTGSLDMDFNKSYKVVATLTPGSGAGYKYVFELYEDGVKKGTGIMDDWPAITSDVVKNINRCNIQVVATQPCPESEVAFSINRIRIKAIQPDVPINTTFYPENGNADTTLDTECYVEFESAIQPVTKENVEVFGGATVTDVTMSNANKRVNITLDGLKADSAYTIKVKNALGVNAEKAFDYEWSFSTNSGITIGDPYFGESDIVIDAETDGITFDNAVVLTDSKYLNGEEWGTNDVNNIGSIVKASGSSILGYFKSEDGTAKEGTVAKKFTPVDNGETLTVSGSFMLSQPVVPNGKRSEMKVSLKGTDTELVIFDLMQNQYWNDFLVLHSGKPGAWDKHDDTQKDVTTTGTARFSSSSEWTNFTDDDSRLGTGDSNSMGDRPNSGKNWSYIEGVVEFELTATPNSSDSSKYNLTLTLVGPNINTTSTKTVAKEVVQALDNINIMAFASFDAGAESENMNVSNLKVVKSVGQAYLVAGENIMKIDYSNLTNDKFNAHVLVIERDAETDEIIETTIFKKEDIDSEEGTFTFDLDITQNGTKVDIYAFNDVDKMILLSSGKTFDVE